MMEKGSVLQTNLTEKICDETARLALETLCQILQDQEITHLAKLPAVKLALELEKHQRKIQDDTADISTKTDREKTRQELEREYTKLLKTLKPLA